MKINNSLLVSSLFAFLFSLLQVSAQDCAAIVKVNQGGNTLTSVAYHDGTAIAAGQNGLVLLSTDGRTWTDLNSGTTDTFVDAVWAGDRFALLANRIGVTTLWTWDDVNGLVELPDLINRITGKEGYALGWVPPNLLIAYTDNLFVRGEIRTTQDFVTLSQTDIDRSFHCGRITDIDTVNGVTAMGYQCIDSSGFISLAGAYVSMDGTSFPATSFTNFDSLGSSGLATNGSILFASSSKWDPDISGWVSHFYHTPDAGTAFTEYPEDGSLRTQSRDADWIDPYFIGVGPIGTIIKSSDGLNWQPIPSPNLGMMRKVVPYEPGQFLAVGENATILLGTLEAFTSILDTWPETSTCSDLILSLEDCLTP